MRFSYAEAMCDPSHYVPLARAAEEAGYTSMTIPDSICYPRESDSRYPYTPDGERTFIEDKPFIEPFVLMGAYRAYKEEDELDLTNKEFELLRLLLMRPGTLVRRDEVVRAIWNMSLGESGKTLDVHMSGLRKKLGDDARKPVYIETVRSVGFRLATEPG